MKICTICGAVMGIGSPHSEEIKRQWECRCGNIATEIYTLAEREEIRQKAFADSLIGKMPEIRQFALEQLQTRDKWESEFWHQYGEEIDLQFSNDDGGFEVYAYPVKPNGETDTSIFVEIENSPS